MSDTPWPAAEDPAPGSLPPVKEPDRRSGSERRSRWRPSHGWRSRDVLRGTLLVLALYWGLRLLWFANQLVLVAFLGVLFGLAVSAGVDQLQRRLRLPRAIGAFLIVFGFLGLLGGFVAWSGPTLTAQSRELKTRLPQALDAIDAWVAEHQDGFFGSLLGGNSAVAVAVDSAGSGGDVAPDLGGRAPGATAGPIGAAARPVPAPQPAVVAPPVASPLPPGADADSARRADSVAAAVAAAGDSAARDTVPVAALPPDSVAADSVAADSAAVVAADSAPAAAAPAALPPAAAATAVASPTASDTTSAAPTLRARIMSQLGGATKYLFPFLSSTLTVIAGLLLVVFLALYVAVEPRTYHGGLMHLFPHESRKRAGEVLTAIAVALRKWLVTQLIAMIVIGSVTTIVLLLLDVRAALPLGVLAGLLEFIPTVGPILSAVPAIAMGFVDSPEKALWVAIAYWGIQFLENQLLIPILMREGVDLPPALTIMAQALMALVFGFLGLLVAVPVFAAGLVAVKLLYVEGVVGDEVEVFDTDDD